MEVERTAQAGAWLDPFCDKIFFTSTLIAVAWSSQQPVLLAFLIGTRELALAPFALLYHTSERIRRKTRFDFTAGWPGKATTVAQFIALGGLILSFSEDILWSLAGVASVLGFVAAIYYLVRAYRSVQDNRPANAPSGL